MTINFTSSTNLTLSTHLKKSNYINNNYDKHKKFLAQLAELIV